jgi:hypothetical protein
MPTNERSAIFYEPETPLLLVAHDAGGAELVAAWAKKHLRHDYNCIVEGPAENVFFRYGLLKSRLESRNEAIRHLKGFRTVLTGTSWSSDLEKIFVDRATRLEITTICYLDHWTDYRSRFLMGEKLVLPSLFWVGDKYAKTIAETTFPGKQVIDVGNFYLEGEVEKVKAHGMVQRRSTGRKNVLFVSEPLSAAARKKYGDEQYYGYTEYDALAAFLDYAGASLAGEIEFIRIRRHPSEKPGKYAEFVDENSIPAIAECGDASLEEDLAWADWIIGCQSMAMVVALMAGKQVFSAIPPGGRSIEIPLPGIVPLFKSATHCAEQRS